MKGAWQYNQIVIFVCLIFFLSIKTITAQSKADQLEELFDYYNENGMFNGIVLCG